MKRQHTYIAFVAALCLVAVWAPGCNQSKANRPQAQAQEAPNTEAAPGLAYVAPGTGGIATMKVRPESISDYVALPAKIQADPTRVVHVLTPAGGRITEMKVRPWDHVIGGQTLAILDSGDLARAVADYRKALIDNRVKQEALERAAFLFAHSAIARKDLQQAQGDAESAQAEVEAARTQLQIFGVNPKDASSQLRVVAPRGGVILDVGAAQGEFSNGLSAPQPLCTIADLSTVWAVGDLPERDFSSVRVGDPAVLTLVAFSGKTWRGRVGLISSSVDPVTRTLRVRVILRNERTTLRPDMYGMLKVLRSTHVGFEVPTTAVIREGSSNYIYVQRSPGRFGPQPVILGAPTGDNEVEILSGLKPSEAIVTEGAVLLRPATQ